MNELQFTDKKKNISFLEGLEMVEAISFELKLWFSF